MTLWSTESGEERGRWPWRFNEGRTREVALASYGAGFAVQTSVDALAFTPGMPEPEILKARIEWDDLVTQYRHRPY